MLANERARAAGIVGYHPTIVPGSLDGDLPAEFYVGEVARDVHRSRELLATT
ncbi:hypothetical protein CLV43_1276 [Umezawaea tangerina]|uniref:Uncharacterized protein n=1 Tax=Umezawaea tangerina TaxID=84725 RepID=A0A2T0S5G4_9PSEU|nr:hypothetical protein CLV43_1276 [Umezawaea tangerina]